MLAVRTPAGLQTVKNVKVRDAANVLRSCAFVKIRDAANVLRTVWSAFAASVSRTDVDGFGDSTGAITIQTANVTANPSGGTGPFTYAWGQVGGDAATILSPTSATTAFRFTGVSAGSSAVGIFVCTITDSAGSTAATPPVTATATNVNTA
jgi:hypothetical protein